MVDCWHLHLLIKSSDIETRFQEIHRVRLSVIQCKGQRCKTTRSVRDPTKGPSLFHVAPAMVRLLDEGRRGLDW